MIDITIDGKPVSVAAGTSVLDACRTIGVDVPTMCFMKGYDHFTSCMICVVLEERSGRLLPSCSAPAEDGMVIDTQAEKVRNARRDALELMLAEHVGDCNAPCSRACPAGIDIPVVIRAIVAGNTRDVERAAGACMALSDEKCPARCEKACRRGRVDSPVSICLLMRFASNGVPVDPLPLRGEGLGEGKPLKQFDSRLGRLHEGELEEFMKEAEQIGRIEPAGDSFTSNEAILEAGRCMNCDCRKKTACALRNLSDEYGADQKTYSCGDRRHVERVREHASVVYEPGKCIKCGRCVHITERAGEDPGLAFLGRGLDVRVGVPFGGSMEQAMTTTADECVMECPTGALAFKQENES